MEKTCQGIKPTDVWQSHGGASFTAHHGCSLIYSPEPALKPPKLLRFGHRQHRKASPSLIPLTQPQKRNSFLLLWSLNDQVYSQPIFDPVLIQRVSILQDLPGKDQNQLILFGFKPPGNLFFELKNKQSAFQTKDQDQKCKANTPDITSIMQTA